MTARACWEIFITPKVLCMIKFINVSPNTSAIAHSFLRSTLFIVLATRSECQLQFPVRRKDVSLANAKSLMPACLGGIRWPITFLKYSVWSRQALLRIHKQKENSLIISPIWAPNLNLSFEHFVNSNLLKELFGQIMPSLGGRALRSLIRELGLHVYI